MRICLILFIFSFQPAFAEYRMFLLQFTSADGTPGAQIPSTLDPDQYRGYHPVKEGESLTYIDTWMCRGSTNEMPACPSPRDPASLSSTTPAVLETPAAAPDAGLSATPAPDAGLSATPAPATATPAVPAPTATPP